ncbi:unnamed protein product [marine sediment metagenome]|uniref:Thiamine pyrophosphate enzyme TPP-binding domain-containing protein n=1 Tax=marine sediment metagenome TaxID=412755 RepID=X1GKI7_9ZZZZ
MRYDFVAAIGVCLDRDKRPVVVIAGDGSIQMNIQALQTTVYHELPIKILLFNNQVRY